MNPLYTTTAVATGDGRNGHVQTIDGVLVAPVRTPKELGGEGGATNPEQLFAAGYAACFESAMRLVARKQSVPLGDGPTITAEVALVKTAEGAYQLAVDLTGHLPGLPEETARALMNAAHQVCPYSRATRGNIDVSLSLASSEHQDAVSL